MRQIRIITHGSQMAMADVFYLRDLIATRMSQEAPDLPYNIETRDSLDLVMIEATTQPVGKLVINNAGDIAYWDADDEEGEAD